MRRMFPRPVWILFAGTFINRFGGFVLVFLILYLTRRGFSPAQAGLVVGAYGIGAMVASMIGGDLADRIGRRNTIALSMFAAAAALVGLERARELPAIVTLTVLAGLTAEAYRPAAGALLADLVEPAQRVTAFAWYRLAINLGTAIGPLVGGLIAGRSMSWLFWGDALTCALYGAIALVSLPEVTHAPHPPSAEPPLTVVLRDRAFMRFLGASTLGAIVYAQSHSTLALQVAARGFSDAAYGMLVGLNGLVVLLLELPIASVTRRLPKVPVIAFAYVLVGLGFALTGVPVTVWLMGATVVIWTLGEIVGAPVAAAYVADLAPAHLRGRYQGAWGLTFALGYVIGPALGAAVFGWRPAVLWIGCLVFGVMAAALVALRPVRSTPV